MASRKRKADHLESLSIDELEEEQHRIELAELAAKKRRIKELLMKKKQRKTTKTRSRASKKKAGPKKPTKAQQRKLDKELYDECSNSWHYGGRPNEVERLVKLGANGSGYTYPYYGWTALMNAAGKTNAKCVKLMLSTMSKDEAAVQDKNGMTALSCAARDGPECVELLLQHMDRRGVMLKTWDGQTAKDIAQKEDHTEILDLFEEYGY